MIKGLKPYPKMKDSGVSWLGRVPEHWALRRMKTVLHERVEKGFPAEPLLAATQTQGVVRKERYENRTVVAMKDLHLLKLVRTGDFVISLRSFQGGIEYAREQGIISPAYTILYSCEAHSHGYLARLFKSSPYIGNLSLYVTGIRQGQNIDYEKLARDWIPDPPPSEQSAIASFLSHADRRIRRLIRSKQKLITLLEEQKQAIIHRAVTRGLDQSVRLKASGIEWLGDIPEHWQVARAASVSKLLSAKAHEHFVEPDGEHICVTARFVSTNGRSFRRCTKNLSPALRGDVLMVMSDLPRGRALARTFLVSDERSYAVNQRVCILRSHGVEPRFLSYVANRHPELLAHDDGFNQTHLPNGAFKIMRLPLPPLQEQARIAESLDRDTAELDRTSERAAKEITLLGEFRTRLISDVVTGKLDVREASERLPADDLEGDDPLGDTDSDSEEYDDALGESGEGDGDGA